MAKINNNRWRKEETQQAWWRLKESLLGFVRLPGCALFGLLLAVFGLDIVVNGAGAWRFLLVALALFVSWAILLNAVYGLQDISDLPGAIHQIRTALKK